jgi:hypothetical protein
MLVDTFEPGGIILSSENLTNWVITGNCIRESPSEDLCLVEYNDYNCAHPVPVEAIINDEVYWSKDFGSVEAAWHQDDIWRNTIPPKMKILVITVHSPVNIFVQDSFGRSVGTDENGVFRYEISNAIYSGPDAEPEMIIIDNPYGEYEVYVYGIEDGKFDFSAWMYSNGSQITIEDVTNVNIKQGELVTYIVPEFPETIAILTSFISMLIAVLLKRKGYKT